MIVAVLLAASATSLRADPTYYWAIPGHNFITMTPNGSPSFNFLNRNGSGLENIEQLTLAHPQPIQAIMLDSTESAIACARAWLQPIHALGRCGQPAGFFRSVLFWDSSRLTVPPHWATLWDVARYPGQRAFFRGPRLTLELALLADGVPPGKIYSQLSTQAGIDRAFRKLSQLRPYIIWWKSPSEAYHILQEQTVLMGITPSGIILSPQTRNTLARPYQAQMENILYSPAVWGIPATLPARKSDETRAILLANPPRLADIPTPMPTESLEISDSFWATHAILLGERFDAWLAQPQPPEP